MSKIEWTDKTWNPIIGCSKTSPACDHCYAERMAFRHSHNPKAPIEYKNVVTDSGTWNGQTAFVKSVLEKPLHWRKPCRVFVGSMTDLFHPSTPFEWIDRVFAVMALTPHITYQVLTKRPERMREYLGMRAGTAVKVRCKAEVIGRNLSDNHPGLSVTNWRRNGMNQVHAIWPLPNVWLGVTVENQEMADKRTPILLDTPAAVRFVSIDPMLEGINLYNGDMIKGLDWVICGGETGPGARPMEEGWVQWLHGQCLHRGVPFFFKKWGSYKGDWKIPHGEKIGGQIVREFPATNGR